MSLLKSSSFSIAMTALLAVSSCLPTLASATTFNSPDTSVQMFHWRWTDLAKECHDAIGPIGYGAVQISPPQASKLAGSWWDVYQPVNYGSLKSHMGTAAELKTMIAACHAAHVRVYADIVANQLALDSNNSYSASDGSNWNASTLAYPQFSSADFHAKCEITDTDYTDNASNVRNCRLNGMPDLNSSSSYVQGVLANYMEKLLSLGIDGFRLDAAKHQAPADIAAILSKVKSAYPQTLAGEDIWVTQEIIPDGSVKRADYYKNGTINEFNYTTALMQTFRNTQSQNLAALPTIMGLPGNWGGTWNMMPSKDATVFVNNWDTERTSAASLNASNQTFNDEYLSKRYDLANIFMLAWPYGSQAEVHSGFLFSSTNSDAPTDSPYDSNLNPIMNVKWDFIHRWAGIASMVKFRSTTDGQGVSNWVTGSGNQIAFSRGNVGFVAINNDTSSWTKTFQTGLAEGTYCNVIKLTTFATPITCTTDKVVVKKDGTASLTIPANNGDSVTAVAIYTSSKIK